jgi:hypothetical protein
MEIAIEICRGHAAELAGIAARDRAFWLKTNAAPVDRAHYFRRQDQWEASVLGQIQPPDSKDSKQGINWIEAFGTFASSVITLRICRLCAANYELRSHAITTQVSSAALLRLVFRLRIPTRTMNCTLTRNGLFAISVMSSLCRFGVWMLSLSDWGNRWIVESEFFRYLCPALVFPGGSLSGPPFLPQAFSTCHRAAYLAHVRSSQ